MWGPLPAGATLLGWPNCGVDGQLNKEDEKSHRIKVEMYDASADEDEIFPSPPPSQEHEKRRRVDGGGNDGANFDSVDDNREESTLLSWVDGNIMSQGCNNQKQEDERSLSPRNGGMQARGVDMQNLKEGSLPTVGEQGGGAAIIHQRCPC